MEWSCFVTEGALKRLQPNVERSEASLLLVFDTHRAAIYAVAITTYNESEKALMSSSLPTFRRGIEAD